MRIVYCTKHITNHGGVERILTLKANYLAELGHDVSIISVADTYPEPFYEIDPRVKLYSLGCNHFFAYHGLKKKLRFRRNVKTFVQKITPLLSEIKPDIVISTFDRYSRYIYMVGDRSRKILERHSAKHKRAQYMGRFEKYRLGRIFTRFYRRKEYRVIKKFDKYVVLTEEDREMWGRMPNITHIPNCMTFSPETTSDLSSQRIIALGRINKWKRFDALIRIWSMIADDHPDWRLDIYGNGKDSYIDELKALINSLGLKGRAEINPPTREVEKKLCDSSIFVMTSHYEGLPMVLLEAMSCGLPAVSYACLCGPRDIIDDGENGFLIPPGDERMFAEKLSMLIEDEEMRTRMGNTAYNSVSRFSPETVMKKWVDMFDRLLQQ